MHSRLLIPCVFYISFITTTQCSTSNYTFPKVQVTWDPESKPRFGYFITEETANNLGDVVPEVVKTWGRFSISARAIYSGVPKVPHLKKNSVADITNVVKLSLSDCKIEDIELGAFANLPHLETLALDYNDLTEIKSGTFANLSISYLNLNDNKISVLQPGAFGKLPNLRSLSLSMNRLKEFPAGIFDENSHLTTLSVMQNRLNKIAVGALTKLKNLVVLDLQYNSLTEINCSEFKLPRLQKLDLSTNENSNFNRECVENMPSLRSCNLHNNQLSSLSEGFFANSKIEELDLSSNQLSSVAATTFDIPALRRLDLSHNKLSVWDARFLRNTPKLERLAAPFNRIGEIPDEAFNSDISVIDLADNQISSVSSGAFRNVKKMEHLNLGGNRVEGLDWNELLRNVSVRYLNVANKYRRNDPYRDSVW